MEYLPLITSILLLCIALPGLALSIIMLFRNDKEYKKDVKDLYQCINNLNGDILYLTTTANDDEKRRREILENDILKDSLNEISLMKARIVALENQVIAIKKEGNPPKKKGKKCPILNISQLYLKRFFGMVSLQLKEIT